MGGGMGMGVGMSAVLGVMIPRELVVSVFLQSGSNISPPVGPIIKQVMPLMFPVMIVLIVLPV